MMKFDAFISYSSVDKVTADTVCAKLEGINIRCWIAPRDVVPGREYATEIIEAIDRCRLMVLIFSSHANKSLQVHREIERAASKGVPIVPFRIEEVIPTESMEYFLGGIHWLDALTPPLELHLRHLEETAEAILRVKRSEDSTSPVRGKPAVRLSPGVTPLSRSQPALRSVLVLSSLVVAAIVAAGWKFIWRSYEPSAQEAPTQQSQSKRPVSDIPALLISPVTKDRVRPLDGYPVIDADKLIFAEGARLSLELTHPSSDTRTVIVRSISPQIKYTAGQNSALSYIIASQAIGGSGIAEPRRFTMRLNGDQPPVMNWVDDSGERKLAKPDNLLELDPPRFLTLNDKDPVELLDISVVATRTGTYDVGFKIDYAVDGFDMAAETAQFRIYRN
jgi:hypothetical protein